jgi:hypothetical protein
MKILAIISGVTAAVVVSAAAHAQSNAQTGANNSTSNGANTSLETNQTVVDRAQAEGATGLMGPGNTSSSPASPKANSAARSGTDTSAQTSDKARATPKTDKKPAPTPGATEPR